MYPSLSRNSEVFGEFLWDKAGIPSVQSQMHIQDVFVTLSGYPDFPDFSNDYPDCSRNFLNFDYFWVVECLASENKNDLSSARLSLPSLQSL